MHTHDSLFRHEVVHNREDAFFHLSGVLGTEDDDLLTSQVENHAGVGGHPFGVSVGREGARVEDHIIGLPKTLQLLGCGAYQHIMHKQRVIGTGTDDADLQSILRVPTGEAVQHVQLFASVEIVDGTLEVDIVSVFMNLTP